MNRLTKKNSMGQYFPQYERETNKNYYDLVYKLGKLEDIEEELGIDLITLFKVNNNININKKFYKVYSNSNNIIEEKFSGSASIDLENKEFIIGNDVFYYVLSFEDYGKTWSLDRKELENEEKI